MGFKTHYKYFKLKESGETLESSSLSPSLPQYYFSSELGHKTYKGFSELPLQQRNHKL